MRTLIIILTVVPYTILGMETGQAISLQNDKANDGVLVTRMQHDFSTDAICVNGRRAKAPCTPAMDRNPCERPFDFTHTCQLLLGRSTDYYCCESADFAQPLCPNGDVPTYVGCYYQKECMQLECILLTNQKDMGCCTPPPTTTTTTTTTQTPKLMEKKNDLSVEEYLKMLVEQNQNRTNKTKMAKSRKHGMSVQQDQQDQQDPTVTVISDDSVQQNDVEQQYDQLSAISKEQDSQEKDLGQCIGTMDKPKGSCTLEFGKTLISLCSQYKNHYCVMTTSLQMACCPLLIPIGNSEESSTESENKSARKKTNKRKTYVQNDDHSGENYELLNLPYNLWNGGDGDKSSEESGATFGSCPKTGFSPGKMCLPENGLMPNLDFFKCDRNEKCEMVSVMGYRCCKKKVKRNMYFENMMQQLHEMQNFELPRLSQQPNFGSPMGLESDFGSPLGLGSGFGSPLGLGSGFGSMGNANLVDTFKALGTLGQLARMTGLQDEAA